MLAANSPSYFVEKLLDPGGPTRGFDAADDASISAAAVGRPTPKADVVAMPFLAINAGWDFGLSGDGGYWAGTLTG